MSDSQPHQFTDQVSMNLTAVDSSVRPPTFPELQPESPDMGTNDVTIQMEVECDPVNRLSSPASGSTKTQASDGPGDMTTVGDNVHCTLTNLADRIRDISTLHLDVRELFDATLRDVLAAVTQTELTSRANLEVERELALQPLQGIAGSTDSTNALPSVLDQTVVFELLERLEAESREELTRMKANYEGQLEQRTCDVNRLKDELEKVRKEHTKELEDLIVECHQAKNLSSRLKAELEHVRTERCNEYDQLREAYRKAKDESDRLRSDLETLNAERNKECADLRLGYDQLKSDYAVLKDYYERLKAEHTQNCEDLRTEYSQVKDTLKAVVDRYVPQSLFPFVRESLPRLSHALDTILKRCPWLFSAITDENQDPAIPLPNPITLLTKQQHMCEKLMLERNDAQDKFQRVANELAISEKVCSSLRADLDSAVKQQEMHKEEIAKLNKKVLRYRNYMLQVCDPKIASRLAAMCATVTPRDDDGRGLNGSVTDTPQPITGFSSSVGCSHEGSTILSKRSPQRQEEHRDNSSSSVLSKVGAAVTALATAIVSPRRALGKSHSPETRVASPAEKSGTARTISQQTSTHPEVKLAVSQQMQDDRPHGDGPLPESSVGPFRAASIPANEPAVKSRVLAGSEPPADPSPFVVPMAPRAPQPALGKRKVLGEIPISVTTGTVTQPDPVPSKHAFFDPNASFFNLNPLAESTSGPFPKPPQPFTEASKRTRYDQNPPLNKSPASGPSKPSVPTAPRSTALRIQTPGHPKKSDEDLQDCVLS
ncbi:hypothetical protein CSKR_109603 [Clonorchis sinensis]|uniref:Uncharacterized protein n=1 Tax=Clonorchis sinensis TaxID=79923 RepID=A0A8T1MY35_CLOSI|nr:hypothetical protein CSKR_109603 [Clonorchis sinensis]